VLDQQHRNATLVADAADEPDQLFLLAGGEAGGRLIEQKELRPRGQRAGDLDPPLPAIG